MHGLNMYDYSVRHYDPAIGRFSTVDLMEEKYYSISPYGYCNNNPMKYIDPTGMSYGDYYDKYTGEHVHNDDIDDDKVYIRDTKTHFTSGGSFGGSTAVTTTTDTYLGQKSDIPDKTVEFTAQLEKTNDFFASKKEEYSGLLKTGDRLGFFAEQVGNEKPFDIKRQNGPFHEDNAKWENGHAFFNGKLLRSDDFGNFNYGVAGKALGISGTMLELGAGLNQISNKITKGSPVGGILSYGDDYKDNSMIKQGIKYYNQNFKK